MSFKRRTAIGLTTGQRDYLEGLKDVDTTVAITGRVTSYEVTEVNDDDPRGNRVAVTIEADDGATATHYITPPLSAEESADAAAYDEQRIAAALEAERVAAGTSDAS